MCTLLGFFDGFFGTDYEGLGNNVETEILVWCPKYTCIFKICSWHFAQIHELVHFYIDGKLQIVVATFNVSFFILLFCIFFWCEVYSPIIVQYGMGHLWPSDLPVSVGVHIGEDFSLPIFSPTVSTFVHRELPIVILVTFREGSLQLIHIEPKIEPVVGLINPFDVRWLWKRFATTGSWHQKGINKLLRLKKENKWEGGVRKESRRLEDNNVGILLTTKSQREKA